MMLALSYYVLFIYFIRYYHSSNTADLWVVHVGCVDAADGHHTITVSHATILHLNTRQCGRHEKRELNKDLRYYLFFSRHSLLS